MNRKELSEIRNHFNPEAKYFTVGKIGDDQLNEYAEKRGFPVSVLKKLIS